LGEEGMLEIEEYIYLFGDSFDKETLTNIDNIKVKVEKEIVIDKEMNVKIYSEAIDFFHEELFENKKALQELKDRGRTEESIIHFKVGWISNVDKLYNRLSRNYSIDELEDCGLFKFNDDGNAILRLPYNSYSYPVYWKNKVRNIKTKNGKDGCYIGKKYAGNDFVMFFNSGVLDKLEIIFVEGENDAMRLWEKGKKNVVAILGQLSKRQIEYLKKKNNERFYSLCFDNDEAGEVYTKKFVNAFKGIKKHTVTIIEYDGKDPDEGSNFNWEGEVAKEVSQDIKYFENNYIKVEVGSKIIYANKKYRNLWLNYPGLVEKHINNINNLNMWRSSNNIIAERGVCCNYLTTDYIVDDKFNMFDGFQVKSVKNKIPVKWLEFVKEVICNNNKEYFDYLMDFLSDLFQNPNSSTSIVPVIISKQGAGKGLFIQMLQNILGKKYSTRVDSLENILGQFNEIIENKLFINLDEATFGRSKKEQGRLKSLTGNSNITINGKNRPAYNIDFSARFVVTSNDMTPVGVEEGDRRFFVLEASDKYIGNKSYYNAIWAELDDDNLLSGLLYYLENRTIDASYNRFIVKNTIYKQDMINDVIDSIGQWLVEVDEGLSKDEYNWNIKVDSNNRISIKSLHSCYIGWYDDTLKNSKYEIRYSIAKFSKLMRKSYWDKKVYKNMKINGITDNGFII